MTHFHLFSSGPQRRSAAERGPDDSSESIPVEPGASGPELATDSGLFEPEPGWEDRQKGRNIGEKLSGGLVGLRHAIRGDSSFFAHGYRGLLIALTATILSVGPLEWCLLIVSAAIVLGSELFHSALDRLARSPLLRDDRDVVMAREIAGGAMLVASLMSALITLTVLINRLGFLLGW